MNKDTYILNFMGPSTVGKSRIISTCIQNQEIATYIHKDNMDGKTKGNVVYIINYDKESSMKLVPKINQLCAEFIEKKEDKLKFKINEFKKTFSVMKKINDFEGIEILEADNIDIKEISSWLKGYLKKIEEIILERYIIKDYFDEDKKILSWYKYFEDNLIYNKLFDIEVELRASDKFKEVLEQYNLKQMILIDTRGVFDSSDKLQRSYTSYTPDVNIFIFDEKGVTEHLFNQIYDELKPMFGKSFEICIRSRTHLDAPIATIENCISPTKNKNFSKKFETMIKFLEEKNVLEGSTVFDIRLREQIGTILPEIPNKDDYCLNEQQMEAYNNKYNDIICGLFNKVMGLKQQEENAINNVIQKCKNKEYKNQLIENVIYGLDSCIFRKYAIRCRQAVNGVGDHLQPKPQSGKIQNHISSLFFNNVATEWIEDEYICNIVTYEAANLLNEAVEQIRENQGDFSDEELSEYLFVLKSTLASCQATLSKWESYVFFESGYSKTRIPYKYYRDACGDTILFSKGGKTYYTIYEEIEPNGGKREHKSALLNCIIESVAKLLQDKLEIDKIIINNLSMSEN